MVTIKSNKAKFKADHVYLDHYEAVSREKFVRELVRMKKERSGAILRKKNCTSKGSKIVTAIFDDVAEAYDEMRFEIGSLIENNSAVQRGSLVFSKYQAQTITAGLTSSRTVYRIYSLNNKSVVSNNFSLSI